MTDILERRSLGRTGRTIPVLALGCVTFGREIDEEESYRVMDYAIEKGLKAVEAGETYFIDVRADTGYAQAPLMRGGR